MSDYRTKTVIAIIAVLFLLGIAGCTTTVRGRQRPLVRAYDTKASLEYSLDSQSNDRKSSSTTTKSETMLMEELLKLQVKGDVYDPKLMSYTALAGFGLSQQEYDSGVQSGRENGDLLNYGFNASFLPTKFYPFSIGANQTDSLIPRAFQSPLRVDDSNESLNLKLRVPDWPMTFSWSSSDLSQKSDVGVASDMFDRSTDRFSYTTTHDFSDFSRLRFRSDIDQITQSSGTLNSDVKTQRHRLEHDYYFGDFKQHHLESRISFYDRKDQFDSKTFDWSESLVLKHSPEFTTFYNTIFSDSTFDTIDAQSMMGIMGFIHQLYANLTTQGQVYASKSDFGSTNETQTRGGRINFDYYRNNPWGLFQAELEFEMSNEETSGDTGTATVINEAQVFNDPFAFLLDQRRVIASTIVITDVTGLLLYTEGDDYTITEVGDQVEITCTTLGSIFPNISDGQTLLIDYQYEIIGDLEEDTFGRRFRIEQQFNNGISVYFSHRLLDKEVDSDINPDLVPDDTETNLYGIEYQFKRMKFTAEHIETESVFQTSESDRIAASGSWPLKPKTSVSGNLSHTWIDTTGENVSRDSTLFRAEGRIRTRLSQYTRLSGRLEYRSEDDSQQGPTDGYRIGSSLDFARGNLRLRTGFDVYFLERRNTESETTRFYLDLTRFF